MNHFVKAYKTKACENIQKLGKCPLEAPACNNYHDFNDRRRPIELGYNSILCLKAIVDGFCSDLDCGFCNNYFEYCFHPGNYKTLECSAYKVNQVCCHGLDCPFYHNLFEKMPKIYLESEFKKLECDLNRIKRDAMPSEVPPETLKITSDIIRPSKSLEFVSILSQSFPVVAEWINAPQTIFIPVSNVEIPNSSLNSHKTPPYVIKIPSCPKEIIKQASELNPNYTDVLFQPFGHFSTVKLIFGIPP